jgi:hypothetical protein
MEYFKKPPHKRRLAKRNRLQMTINHCFLKQNNRQVVTDVLPLQTNSFRSAASCHEEKFNKWCVVLEITDFSR